MKRHGGYRWTDPSTAVASAMSVDVTAREYEVLLVFSIAWLPINEWEVSLALDRERVSISPRMAPLREKGMIEQRGTRPGPPPTRKAQMAYVITPRGLAFLASVRR